MSNEVKTTAQVPEKANGRPSAPKQEPEAEALEKAGQEANSPYTNADRMEVYKQSCDQIETGQRSSSEQYDKAILTLSSGGLALSIAFVKDIVPIPHVVWMPILLTSWGLFAVSILSTLISFVVSQHAYDEQRKNLDDFFLKNVLDACSRPNKFTTATTFLNYLSGICFVVAVSLTIIFASKNIVNERDRAKQTGKPAITEQVQEDTKMGDEKIVPPQQPEKLVPQDWTGAGNKPPGIPNMPPPTPPKDSGSK